MEKLRVFYSKNVTKFVILKYILFAALFSVLAIVVDSSGQTIIRHIPSVFLTSGELARKILTTLVGALLTITTFTFSTTMVVLTMYSSQFSPRVVENFLSDRTTLKVLGIFVGGFFYSIITLFFTKSVKDSQYAVSATIGVIYALFCIVYFIVFIFKVSKSIQASNLIKSLDDEASKTLDEIISAHKDLTFDIAREPELEKGSYRSVISPESGYIQNIQYDTMLELIDSSSDNSLIYVPVNIGDFVTERDEILRVYGESSLDEKDIEKIIKKSILIDKDRNITFDYMFSLQKMSDIALRAISPGINDPNTAIYCINMLGTLMGKLASVEYAYCRRESENGTIIYRKFDFSRNLYSVFYQIVNYGKGDLTVIGSVFKALGYMTLVASPENRDILARFASVVYQEASKETSVPAEKELLDKYYLSYKDSVI